METAAPRYSQDINRNHHFPSVRPYRDSPAPDKDVRAKLAFNAVENFAIRSKKERATCNRESEESRSLVPEAKTEERSQWIGQI